MNDPINRIISQTRTALPEYPNKVVIMFIVTDDLEIINFNQYRNLSVKGEEPEVCKLVLTAQDGSERVIAEFSEFEEAFNLFSDIRDAIAAGETYYSLESY